MSTLLLKGKRSILLAKHFQESAPRSFSLNFTDLTPKPDIVIY